MRNWHDLEESIVSCELCPRLVDWRREMAHKKTKAHRDQEYWGKPVPGFGDRTAKIAAIGLAPGAHGSNRTGRQFTGDSSGGFLYPALYRAGFASQSQSTGRDDGMVLEDLFLTSVCRCVPPGNKPKPAEILNCRPFLERELDFLEKNGLRVIVALGRIAFDVTRSIYRARGRNTSGFSFAHGAIFDLGKNPDYLIASYHPSRQNTNTGVLTVAMFDRIWRKAGELTDER